MVFGVDMQLKLSRLVILIIWLGLVRLYLKYLENTYQALCKYLYGSFL
jgi:hypothetical protein